MRLNNKVTIITGAGTGIGEAIAHKFAREGARLVLAGLPSDPVRDVADVIASSDDPGRLGRSAYHLIHPVMVAGIIVAAAGDQQILSSPSATATAPAAWMILGGPALFLAGHAAFKYVVWGVVPRTRLAGIAVLALLALAATALPEIALAACAAAVVAAVAAADRRPHPA